MKTIAIEGETFEVPDWLEVMYEPNLDRVRLESAGSNYPDGLSRGYCVGWYGEHEGPRRFRAAIAMMVGNKARHDLKGE